MPEAVAGHRRLAILPRLRDASSVVESHRFTGSGLVFQVSATDGQYWLGPPESFATDHGRRVAAQFGPLPDELLAGYSSFAEAPGWVIALGRLETSRRHVQALGSVAPGSEPGVPTASEEIESCVLAGHWWAAELRTEHVRLQLLIEHHVHDWMRPARRRGHWSLHPVRAQLAPPHSRARVSGRWDAGTKINGRTPRWPRR